MLESPAIEHHKSWSFQTLCLLPGEWSLPIGLLVWCVTRTYLCFMNTIIFFVCHYLIWSHLKNWPKSYTDEHFDKKGPFEIMAHKEDDGVLKAQIRSCHTSNKTLKGWTQSRGGIMGAEVVLAPLGVGHMWLRYLGYYLNETKQWNQTEQDAHWLCKRCCCWHMDYVWQFRWRLIIPSVKTRMGIKDFNLSI